MNRKVHVRTFGCQMNVRDSEVIAGLLRTMSYELTTNAYDADVIIFNTCSVRQHAEDKVWSEAGRIVKEFTKEERRRTKDAGGAPITDRQKPIIGIVGCMAQNYGEKIFERAPQVDFVVGPSDIDKIPKIVNALMDEKKKLSAKKRENSIFQRKFWETDATQRPEEVYHSGFYEDKEHAYVVISEGCSNYCSYCVVPHVRGAIHHRAHKDILKEIAQAFDKGIKNITLLGQNVNAYCDEKVNFVKLLESVNELKGLKEFSFITSHPKDTSVELFRSMADLAKLKKCLHLPVQAGSDRILQLMNRGYTRRFYLDLIEKYRKIVDGGVLTTDIIVGFPSETEQDFQESFDLVNSVECNAAFIFKYSARPNTHALHMIDDVAKEEKERRHRLILELQRSISKKKHDTL